MRGRYLSRIVRRIGCFIKVKSNLNNIIQPIQSEHIKRRQLVGHDSEMRIATLTGTFIAVLLLAKQTRQYNVKLGSVIKGRLMNG